MGFSTTLVTHFLYSIVYSLYANSQKLMNDEIHLFTNGWWGLLLLTTLNYIY